MGADDGDNEQGERGPLCGRTQTLKGPTQSSCCQIVDAMKREARSDEQRGAENVSDGVIVAYARPVIYMSALTLGRSRLDRPRLGG